MKVLKIAGVAVVVLLVLFAGIGLLLPRDWSVERSILIQAPPERIHAWVESPAKWNEWFAWEEMKTDPEYRVWTSGPEKGAGATYEWAGSPMKAGTGKLVIAHSDPKAGVHIDEWINGPEQNAKGSILYTSAGGGTTRVTWTDNGTLPPVIGGYFRGTVNDAMGEAFEKGLANLKRLAEQR
jgi:hypothetical protein